MGDDRQKVQESFKDMQNIICGFNFVLLDFCNYKWQYCCYSNLNYSSFYAVDNDSLYITCMQKQQFM